MNSFKIKELFEKRGEEKMETFKEIFEGIDTDEEIECDDLAEKMFNFIEDTVDIDNLDDERSDDFDEILSMMENYEDEDELDEAAIRKKIKPGDKRARARAYKKNRATLKRKAKKYRKTAKFSRYKKKAKRGSKRGKTSTGKRKTKFI